MLGRDDTARRKSARLGWTMGIAMRLSNLLGWTAGLALAASLAVASNASAAADYTCPNASVAPDDFIQGFALTRRSGGGLEIAVNELRGGIGLSAETKLWLFQRQCHLASLAGANPETDGAGVVIFQLIQHRAADCAAFAAARNAYGGRPGAMRAIERDLARPDFWNNTLGPLRPVSASSC